MAEMLAARIHKFGGPEVIQFDRVPRPEPKADEILVRVCAASVNPVDYKIREGKFPPVRMGDLPITLGRDLSGIVEQRGGSSTSIRKGDAVFALLGTDRGSYAEYAIVKADEIVHMPEDIDHARAAAVPLAAITAWQGLFDNGRLEKDQRVLIHGGAGGVGHMAIQLAKAKGAYVITTASKTDLEFVRGLGADEAVDYKNQRFEDVVKEVDLVYDLIGGETQERSFAVVKRGGAIVSTLQQPSEEKCRALGIRGAHYMAQANGGELAEIASLIDDGKIRPAVHAALAFARAAEAQDALEHDHVRGKIVLEIAPSPGRAEQKLQSSLST